VEDVQFHEVGAFFQALDILAAWDPDQPRDADGRFASLGSTAAHAASKRAHKSGAAADHRAAGTAHANAEMKHLLERDRRAKLSRKRGISKEDRARHKAAAERHEKKAAEHAKLAHYHGGESVKPPVTRVPEPPRERVEPPPPPANGQLLTELGIAHHALSPEAVIAAEGAVRRGGFDRYIRARRTNGLTMGTHTNEESANAQGLYTSSRITNTDHARITEHERVTADGHPGAIKAWRYNIVDPQIGRDNWRVQDLVKHDVAAQRERLWAHELSHHIHKNESLPHELDANLHNAWIRATHGKWAPSEYSRQDEAEWFAEAHSAYIYHHDEFLAADPHGHAVVRDVRKYRGIE
jgi:hypothetical protein